MTKIAAAVQFRNEAANLEVYFENILQVADVVVGFDDRSIDGSGEIFKKLGGVLVGRNNPGSIGWKNSTKVRQSLLDWLKKENFPFMLTVDLDELILEDDSRILRQQIQNLGEDDVLAVKWLNLYGGVNKCAVNRDGSYPSKVVARRLSRDLNYNLADYIHFSQIPVRPSDKMLESEARMIHFQALDLEAFRLKQSWYMMMTIVESGQSARSINSTYRESTKQPRITELPKQISDEISVRPLIISNNWRMREIDEMLANHGSQTFKKLDIWTTPYLKKYAISEWNKIPKPALDNRIFKLLRPLLYRYRAFVGN